MFELDEQTGTGSQNFRMWAMQLTGMMDVMKHNET